LRAHAPHISPETNALLQRMMAVDPQERFPDFNSVAAAAARIPALLAERRKEEEDRLRDMEQEAARQVRKRMHLRWLVTAGCIALAVAALLIYREMR
jgi:Flp pilus assembly protein TadB